MHILCTLLLLHVNHFFLFFSVFFLFFRVFKFREDFYLRVLILNLISRLILFTIAKVTKFETREIMKHQ